VRIISPSASGTTKNGRRTINELLLIDGETVHSILGAKTKSKVTVPLNLVPTDIQDPFSTSATVKYRTVSLFCTDHLAKRLQFCNRSDDQS
jgi:hypothetical protein